MEAKNVYEEVTEKIVKLLEEGVCPWKNMIKPKKGENSFPTNIKSKKPYRGINWWILLCSSYQSQTWGTFNQLKDSGYQVKKGEKATKVIFWKILDLDKELENGNFEKEKIPLLKSYYVFNVEQCESIVKEAATQEIVQKIDCEIEDCEKIISLFPLGMPHIENAPNKAFYNRIQDVICIPNQSDYEKKEEYYQTLFHEYIHCTGHKSRLNRESLLAYNFSGDDMYSQEELIAELGASFLSAFSGILTKTIVNSASYLQNWIKVLKGDSKLIFKASSQAQKAVDYLMNVKFEAEND